VVLEADGAFQGVILEFGVIEVNVLNFLAIEPDFEVLGEPAAA